jgi:hypothetical protein
MTLLTTIIVATPSMTLTIDARAMYRVRKYRQQSKSLYIGSPLPRVISYRLSAFSYQLPRQVFFAR